jgi:surfeit locus 1 family protein
MSMMLRRILPTFAAIAVAGTTLSLGFWQLRRAAEREALATAQAAVAKASPIALGREPLANPESFGLHPMSARGVWIGDKAIFLDNQIHKGRAGFHVVMPLRLEGTDTHVLVDRGWLAGTGDRRNLPEVHTPVGVVDVRGFARQSNYRFKELSSTFQEGRIWENITVERYAAWSGLRLQPVILHQTDEASDGLVREWPQAGSGAEKNRAYALQWFSLAALTVAFWGYYFLRGRRGREGAK